MVGFQKRLNGFSLAGQKFSFVLLVFIFIGGFMCLYNRIRDISFDKSYLYIYSYMLIYLYTYVCLYVFVISIKKKRKVVVLKLLIKGETTLNC